MFTKLKVPLLAAVAGIAALALVGSSTATDNPPPDKITICHVAGLASDPANYITLTISPNAVFGPGGHFNENGTTQAGHEQDTFGACNPPPPVDVCPNLEGNQAEVPAGYVKDAQGNCVQEPADIPVTAGVTFTEATCTSGPSFSLVRATGLGFYNVEGPDFVDGKPVPGGTYTITATALDGYVLTGQSVFVHTFAAKPTNCETPRLPTGAASVFCDSGSNVYRVTGSIDGQAADSVTPPTIPGSAKGTTEVVVTRGDTSFRTSVSTNGDCGTVTSSPPPPPPPVVTPPPPPPPAVTPPAAKPPAVTPPKAAPKAPKPKATSKKAKKPPVKLTGNPKKDKCVDQKDGTMKCKGITVVPGSG